MLAGEDWSVREKEKVVAGQYTQFMRGTDQRNLGMRYVTRSREYRTK